MHMHIHRVARRVSHRPMKQIGRVLFSCGIFQVLKPRRSHISKAPVEKNTHFQRVLCGEAWKKRLQQMGNATKDDHDLPLLCVFRVCPARTGSQ